MVRVRGVSELFCELRKIIPEIPENTRSLTLQMSHDSVPLIKCEFFVSGEGCPELLSKTFELVEKEPNVTECPRSAAEAS
jgi:hypothetical protein